METRDAIKLVADAVDAEIMRQYDWNKNWDDAKDVVENLDYERIAEAAVNAYRQWEMSLKPKTQPHPGGKP